MKTSVSLSGTILPPVKFVHTPGKQAFCAFCLSNEKQQLITCKAFGDAAERIKLKAEKERVRCSISGYKDDEGAIAVNHIIFTEDEKNAAQEKYTSKEDDKKYWEEQNSRGFIRVEDENSNICTWPRSDCVAFDDGSFVPKIWFVMDTLGASEVTRRIRSAGITLPTTKTGKTDNPYRGILEALLDESMKSLSFE